MPSKLKLKVTNQNVQHVDNQLDKKNNELHALYQEKLTDLGLTKKGAQRKKAEKSEKEAQGKAGAKALSKYRQQVREALELKKKVDTTIEIESESDDDEIIQQPSVPAPEPIPTPIKQPEIDITTIYEEINNLKKQNKELENKFTYKTGIMDVNNLRRNMTIKF